MSKPEIFASRKDTLIQTKTRKGAFQALRNASLAIAVCGSLALGFFGVAAPAEARPVNPIMAYYCAGLLNERRDLLNEWDRAGDKRRMEIFRKLLSIKLDWDQFCRGTYGDM